MCGKQLPGQRRRCSLEEVLNYSFFLALSPWSNTVVHRVIPGFMLPVFASVVHRHTIVSVSQSFFETDPGIPPPSVSMLTGGDVTHSRNTRETLLTGASSNMRTASSSTGAWKAFPSRTLGQLPLKSVWSYLRSLLVYNISNDHLLALLE